MAGKQVAGDGLSASLAGMSKNQLYDIMSQMKQLIDQNQQQARDILIQNPVLTKALFQAQIMLGMVQSPQAIPNVQPAASQNPQPSKSPIQKSNIQTASSLPNKIGLQDQTINQEPSQPATTVSSASVLPSNLQPPSLPSHPLQPAQQLKGNIPNQLTQMPLRQASQLPNMPHLLHHASSHLPSHLQPPMPSASNQLQQPMQTTSIPHLVPLQPQLPTQQRPPMPTFPHHGHSQIGVNVGFQHSGAPQLNHQPVYHSGTRPPAGPGPSFLLGQPPRPIQAPLQPPYHVGGSQLGMDFNQIVSSNQADRGSPWVSGIKQESTSGAQLPGPPQFPGLMGPGNQLSQSPSLTPEMEKALLQQVMSLTPEQINNLPPEQRNQVLQLQQMLRQ